MTDHDAWAIQKQILQGEFPFMVLKSLQFALFRIGNTGPFREKDRSQTNHRGRHTAFRRYQACSSRHRNSPILPPHSSDTPIRAP